MVPVPARAVEPQWLSMEQVLDREGRVLVLRDLSPLDLGTIGNLLRQLSPRSNRQRFLCVSTTAGPQYVQVLGDPERTLDAVVVESGSDVLGVGSTHSLGDGTAEFALTVEDEYQGHGVGTLLMEGLVARSRQRGVRTLVGTMLGANAQMSELLAHLGLRWRSAVEDGVATVTVDLDDDPAFTVAHLSRAEAAEAQAVRHFLRPTRVAVLEPPGRGRPSRGKGPLEASGLGRAEVAVDTIARVPPGYEVPAGTELAVIPDWLDEAGAAALACAEAGVPAVALLRRGPPVGDRASRLETPLLDRIRAAGAHVLGPRSACLVNTDPLYRLGLGGRAPRPPGGAVAVVTDDIRSLQRLCDCLAARGVGISVAVDVGEAEDLGPDEFVAWLAQDPRTEVIVVLLAGAASESLLSLLGRVHSTSRPVALLAADASGDAASSASPRGGPCRATTVEGLADLTMLLVSQGMPAGRHVAVVTNEPWTVHAAANRRLARRAMLGPDLRQHSEMRIHFVSPGTASHGAVVALPVDVSGEQVRAVLETLAEDPGVDAIVVDHVPSPALRRRTLYRELRGLGRGPGGRVIVAVDRSGPRQQGPTPVFASVPSALDVLAQACTR